MAGFTDEEIQAAVDRFLYKQISTPRLKTGARDVLTARGRVFDLLTTALLLRPDSYFYVVYLAKNRLSALLSQQIAVLDTIVAAGPGTTRPSAQIRTTAELANAQAALLDLTAGLNQRSTGIRGSIGPSVDRFRRSVSAFVSTELTKNVVVSGQVTETGAELRKKISTAWAENFQRHPEIVELATSVSSALTTLESVRLPESSVRDIVQRVQTRLVELKAVLEGTSAIAQSRESMLELLTMRTLLTKASTFRNPEVELMPKRGDTYAIEPIDSAGIEAQIETTVSGPFNYDSGTVFDFNVNGAPISVSLPRAGKGSRAELRSRVFSPWVPPSVGDELAFTVNLSGPSIVIVGGAYADGPTAAAALNTIASVEVSWDAATSQLVFQSEDYSDQSDLVLLTNTVDRQSFRDWAFPATTVFLTAARGEAVPASEVALVLAAVPGVDVDVTRTPLTSFQGTRTSIGGEEAVIWDVTDDGTDATTDLVNTITSPSKNFKTLGVTAGMAIHISAPVVADYTITEVVGNTLTTDAAALPAGPLTYYIGQDFREISGGARVRVTSGSSPKNTGLYRVLLGEVAKITLTRNVPEEDTALIVSVFTESLVVKARGTSTTQSIGVLSASAGSSAMGMVVEASERRPRLTTFQLQGAGDFLLRGTKTGDLVTLTSPSGVATEVSVESLESSSITVDEALPYEAGTWGYVVRAQRGVAFASLQASVGTFLSDDAIDGFSRIDVFVGRLIRGARYTGEIAQGIEDYRSALVALLAACQTYTVPYERTVDNVVKTMREQGFDRALDLLMTLRLDELFSMDPDGVSYSSWLVRQAATVAREVVPVSKFSRSAAGVQEWRPVSFQPNPFTPGDDSGT